MVEESQVTSQKVFHKVYFEHPICLVVLTSLDIFSSEQLSFKIHFQTIKEWQVFVLTLGSAKATDTS